VLAPVQAEVVGPFLLPPQRLVDPVVESLRLAPEASGVLGSIEDVADLGHPRLGIEDVALQLARPDRQRRQGPIGLDDRIPRVLPTLVIEPMRRAGLVLLQAIAIAVAVLVDPGDGGLGIDEIPP
jgi:hypothetical protein